MKTYDERRDDERRNPESEHGPGHETYDEKLERYRRGWEYEDAKEYDADNGDAII